MPTPSPADNTTAPIGLCPQCGAPGKFRERRPNGNDVCENGHIYPSKEAGRAASFVAATNTPATDTKPPTPPHGELTQQPLATPAGVMDAALSLLAGHGVLKGFTLAIVAWPKGLPDQPAIASTAEGVETGTCLARCCQLIQAGLQQAQEQAQPKLIVATPADTEKLSKLAGMAPKNFKKR